LRGTAVEALHDPTAEACIMSEFLRDTILGNMPQVPTDKLLKSPSGLIFECQGIARAVPIEIDEIKVQLDFHIYHILDFDLLIDYPLEKLIQEGASQGSLKDDPRKSAFATSTYSKETPMAKPHPKSKPLEEVMYESSFISSKPLSHLYKTERPSSPSIEFKPCPLGLIFHDESLEKDNSYDMDLPETTTLESKRKDSTKKHESFSLEFPQETCSHKQSPESVSLGTTCSY
jgi:hypothetical protein